MDEKLFCRFVPVIRSLSAEEFAGAASLYEKLTLAEDQDVRVCQGTKEDFRFARRRLGRRPWSLSLSQDSLSFEFNNLRKSRKTFRNRVRSLSRDVFDTPQLKLRLFQSSRMGPRT